MLIFTNELTEVTAVRFSKSIFLVALFCAGFQPLYAQLYDRSAGFEPASETFDRSVLIEQLQVEYETQLGEIETEYLTRKQKSSLKDGYAARLRAGKTLLGSNRAILSGPLYDYVNGIFTTLLRSNSMLDQDSKMVLYRSREFNAFTLGDNIVFVNIGLLYRLRNKEQIALVLAHELSHNVKRHAQQKMLEHIRIQTDEELNRQIKQISNQDYGQVSALNELLLPTIYAERQQSRMHEFEADSLGLVCFLNAGFSAVHSVSLFEIMETAEHVRDMELIDVLAELKIDAANPLTQRYARYTRTSSLGDFGEEEKNASEPYLRSHPYEDQRIEAILRQLNVDGYDTLVPVDEEFLSYRYLVEGEMIYGALSDGDFSDGMYYALRMHQNYPDDNYANSALAYQLGMLSFYKTNRMAGKHVDPQNAKKDEVVDRINFFLQQLNPKEAMDLSLKIRNALPASYENKLLGITDAVYDYSDRKFDAFELRIAALFPEVKKTGLEKPVRELDDNYTDKQQKQSIINR